MYKPIYTSTVGFATAVSDAGSVVVVVGLLQRVASQALCMLAIELATDATSAASGVGATMSHREMVSVGYSVDVVIVVVIVVPVGLQASVGSQRV
jgi:hypothetical protein